MSEFQASTYIHNIFVKCDHCGWKKNISPTIESAKVWHNVHCPQCLKSIIMTDEDMLTLAHMIGLAYAQHILLDVGLFEDGPICRVHIDSSKLNVGRGV